MSLHVPLSMRTLTLLWHCSLALVLSSAPRPDGLHKPLEALASVLQSFHSAGFQTASVNRRLPLCRQALAKPLATQNSPRLEAVSTGTFEERREALKQCLAREYTSFFRPFEENFYSDAVTFEDPLNQINGKAGYKNNVEMLSGESFIGNILFTDGFIDLHAVEDVPGDPTRLRTRWTLGFTFKLLPWKPKALFSGISEYGIDPTSAIVLSQRDYWDTLSLQEGGSYTPEAALDGLVELAGQLLPEGFQPPEALEPPAAAGANWSLLRRAQKYRIYRDETGLVFALEAPAYDGGPEGVERELKLHGLVPGQRITSSPLKVELLPPHPWQ